MTLPVYTRGAAPTPEGETHGRNRPLAIAAAAAALLLLALPAANAFGSASPGSSPRAQFLAATQLGSAFTYQGRLTESGQPANGLYDFRFVLYDADVSGTGSEPIEKGDVNVVNGLFVVDLDFGALGATPPWNGDARWLEIAVRPGASTGSYTTLSPRQRIAPTPYALYAANAGSLALPFSATASTPSGALFAITQSGVGPGLTVARTTTDPADVSALVATNAGGGAAVKGVTASNTGTGVEGLTVGTGGTAGTFLGNGAGTNSLQVGNGAIVVTGNVRPAFVHTVVASGEGANTCDGGKGTVLDNPLINGKPGAILIVTPRDISGTIDAIHPFVVAYDVASGGCATDAFDNHWIIHTTDDGTLPTTASYNVLAILDDQTS